MVTSVLKSKTATATIPDTHFKCISCVYLSLIVIIMVVSVQRKVRTQSWRFRLLFTAADLDQIVIERGFSMRVAVPPLGESGLRWPAGLLFLTATTAHFTTVCCQVWGENIYGRFFPFYVHAAAADLYGRGKYSTFPRLECVFSWLFIFIGINLSHSLRWCVKAFKATLQTKIKPSVLTIQVVISPAAERRSFSKWTFCGTELGWWQIT